MRFKIIINLPLFLLFFSPLLKSQHNSTFFIGLQPGITKEKFYKKQEFDVNIIPIVLQLPINKRVDIRFTGLCNYHFGDKNQISDFGVFTALPIYFKKKAEKGIASSGLYIAPVLGFGRNVLNEHYTTTLAAEPGYMLKLGNRFSLNLALQLGGSYFQYDAIEDVLRSHFGVNVILGIWNVPRAI